MPDPMQSFLEAVDKFMYLYDGDNDVGLDATRDVVHAATDVFVSDHEPDAAVQMLSVLGWELLRQLNEMRAFASAMVAKVGGATAISQAELDRARNELVLHVFGDGRSVVLSLSRLPVIGTEMRRGPHSDN